MPVERQLKEEFGFRTVTPGVRTTYDSRDYLGESLMLTGDLNVAVVEWIVQFKVQDPRAYLFNVREIRSTFRDMSEAAMRDVVGDHSVDEVLTVGRERIAAQAKDLLQDFNDTYETGISVQQLVLQDVNPPDAVKPSFNEVNEAIQEKERLTNEALAEYNQGDSAGPRRRPATGSGGRGLRRGAREPGRGRGRPLRGDLQRVPQRAAGDPVADVPWETISEIMPRLGQKVIIDESGANVLPLLNLNGARAPQTPTRPGENPGGGDPREEGR